jgi:hypothetical protein
VPKGKRHSGKWPGIAFSHSGTNPAGTRGILNDAIAIYVNIPVCAVGIVARWCVPGDPDGASPIYGLKIPHGSYRDRHDAPIRGTD